MATVEMVDINKRFGSNVVLHDFNVTVQDREFLVVIGPSGSGKSTTLRLVAGLEKPTSGEILIGGKRMTKAPPRDRDIAMVFQSYALYPHMSVFENMAFGLRLAGQRGSTVRDRVKAVAEGLVIDPLLRRKPRYLSGGQRQRVAVGRAITRKPHIFLMDEPLSNLDAQLRAQTRVSLLRLHREIESTVMYVTHDQVEAMTLGDRIVVLKDGVIQQVAAPGTLYAQPANRFVAGFIGSPPMNMLPLEARSSPTRLVAPHVEIPVPGSWLIQSQLSAGDRILLGIRPEDLQDEAAARRQSLPLLRGTVEVTEDLGTYVLAHVRVGNHALVAKFDGASNPATAGGPIALGVDLERCHVFEDSEVGPRLPSVPTAAGAEPGVGLRVVG